MKRLITAIAVLAGVLALGLNVGGAKDYLGFNIWELSNQSKLGPARTNSIVLSHWDGWGFAGTDNDRYLVSDPTNELSGALAERRGVTLPPLQSKVAEHWGREHNLKCDVVWVSCLQKGFYLIETYNCMLGVPS